MAAEIAMEHHLGMTCDPVAGLVQTLHRAQRDGRDQGDHCLEMALHRDPGDARVSLDAVIAAMRQTAST
jgi:L-serine dehydratase